MKTWTPSFGAALFASAIVLALAIVFASFNPAISQQRGAGFMMAAGGNDYGWRINTVTGAASYCIRRSNSSDPEYLGNNPPVCSAWTPAAE